MSKTQEKNKIDPEKLLDVAAKLFRKNGFNATTLRDIAREAGILLGSLYYRYPSKEAILLALMERGINRITLAIRQAIASTHDPTERLRMALRAYVKVLVSEDDSVYSLLYEWRALTGEAREAMVKLRDRYESLWDGLIYESAGASRFHPGIDLKLLRLFGFGAINWVAQWYSPKGERTPEQIADAFWAFLAFGVLANDRRAEDIEKTLHSLSAIEPGYILEEAKSIGKS
ncbi:MAG: TetR/AcrR family transcriptional regulator [Acidobacteria bacterium]|nr:TetR/AcrR family transcriptional regulator [Acidobacteriota bacterium]